MSISNIDTSRNTDAAQAASTSRQTAAPVKRGAFSALLNLLGRDDNPSGPVQLSRDYMPDNPPQSKAEDNEIRMPVERTYRAAVDDSPANRIAAPTTTPATTAKKNTPAAHHTAHKSGARKGPGGILWRYESGHNGSEAIGYDRHGGTSYGKYQISSRSGSMQRFIKYLDEKAPDLAERLAASGPANTGSRKGHMPDEWRKIAEEDPQRFESLQHEFIRRTNYEPAKRMVKEDCGLDVETRSPAVREVLWSMAVQHGPNGATRIFRNAMKNTPDPDKETDRSLIENIYSARLARFSQAHPALKAALKSRYTREATQILDIQDAHTGAVI